MMTNDEREIRRKLKVIEKPVALSSANQARSSDRDRFQRKTSGPAVLSAAFKGRRHDCTRLPG